MNQKIDDLLNAITSYVDAKVTYEINYHYDHYHVESSSYGTDSHDMNAKENALRDMLHEFFSEE